jgi:hypothetical protein
MFDSSDKRLGAGASSIILVEPQPKLLLCSVAEIFEYLLFSYLCEEEKIPFGVEITQFI